MADDFFSLDINELVNQQLFIKARCLAKESDEEQQQDWPYNYSKASSSEGGTVKPKPDDNASLFIFPLFNHDINTFDTIDEVPQEILSILHEPMKILSSSGGWKNIIIPHNTKDWETLPFPPNHILYHSYAFTLAKAEYTGSVRPTIQGSVNLKPSYDISKDLITQLKSQVKKTSETENNKKSFTGAVIIMRSKCPIGKAALHFLKDQLNPNQCAFIDHTSNDINISKHSLWLRIETGCGRIPKLPFGQETFLHRNLSTLFKLYLEKSNELVAKCLLSYYCANFDEQGPTIEMISVKKKFRGLGYCKYLYKLVENFCLENWTACGIHNGNICQRIMVTSQPGSQIEINSRNSEKISVADRVFFSQYLGYDEHITDTIQKNIPGQDQVKYFPFGTTCICKIDSLEKPNPYFRKNFGKQPCYYCGQVSAKSREYMRCSICKIAYYCSKGMLNIMF